MSKVNCMSSQITIVIPVYNRAHTIERTLRSIDAQSVRPEKVVVVDNGSTDGSLEIVREWSRREHGFECVIAEEARRGACAARNRGLESVETEFVMFFDSDDEMTPSHVADFSSAISRHPDIDIFGRTVSVVDIAGRRQKAYFTSRSPVFNHLFRGCMSTQRVVVRTSLVRRVGGWNEDLFVWNDFELGARLLLASDRIFHLSGSPSVIVHQQADSITGVSFSSKAGQWEKTLDCMEKLFRNTGRVDLLKWLDCRRMILAAEYSGEGRSELSEKLRAQVLDGNTAARRLKLIYWHNRLFHRLTWLFARVLFAI